ncbi:hypothetical protein BH10CHL1_BH10CHL1_43520 [soil metagenome]
MAPTSEQQSAVERLYENEALIDNLIANVAKPVLQWAEKQIMAGIDAEAIYAAVRAANESDAQDAATALAVAQQTLPPTAVATTIPEAPSPGSSEAQASKTNSTPTLSPAAHEQGRPHEPESSRDNVPTPAPAKVTEPPSQPADKAPTPSPAHMPVVASDQLADRPKQTNSREQRQANRSFLRRWMNWFKPQNR